MGREVQLDVILDAAHAERELQELKSTVKKFTIDGQTDIQKLADALGITAEAAEDQAP